MARPAGHVGVREGPRHARLALIEIVKDVARALAEHEVGRLEDDFAFGVVQEFDDTLGQRLLPLGVRMLGLVRCVGKIVDDQANPATGCASSPVASGAGVQAGGSITACPDATSIPAVIAI